METNHVRLTWRAELAYLQLNYLSFAHNLTEEDIVGEGVQLERRIIHFFPGAT